MTIWCGDKYKPDASYDVTMHPVIKHLFSLVLLLMTSAAYSQSTGVVVLPKVEVHSRAERNGRIVAYLVKDVRVGIIARRWTSVLVQARDSIGWVAETALKVDDPTKVPTWGNDRWDLPPGHGPFYLPYKKDSRGRCYMQTIAPRKRMYVKTKVCPVMTNPLTEYPDQSNL